MSLSYRVAIYASGQRFYFVPERSSWEFGYDFLFLFAFLAPALCSFAPFFLLWSEAADSKSYGG